MSKSRRSSTRSRKLDLLLLLAGVLFFSFGCFATYRAAALVWLWRQVQSWTEVRARITGVDLEVHSGDDTDTYEVVCPMLTSITIGCFILNRLF